MTCQDRPVPASLAAAQEQLHQRRLQCRQERLSQRLPVHTDTHGRSLLPLTPATDSIETLRPGWQSQALARTLQMNRQIREARRQQDEALARTWLPVPQSIPTPNTATPDPGEGNDGNTGSTPAGDETFTLYPDLALAMLQKKVAASGRLWLLLRRLDEQGRGWLVEQEARARLTERSSPLHLCGWRQLRNLLAQGDGIFWQREEPPAGAPARIWLRSPAKVAIALGVMRFNRQDVTAPLSLLLEGMATVRAHFFASFHSSRTSDKPIARRTINGLTGVSRRSQQSYETLAGVKTEQNWAVGGEYSQEEHQQRAWEHGAAVFRLDDAKGKVGSAGAAYVAWQMPNSYQGPHRPQRGHHKKRINRKLADLSNKGMTGNGEREVEKPSSPDEGLQIRYCEHGRAAARSYNRNPRSDHYWRAPRALRRYNVWHRLPAQGALKP